MSGPNERCVAHDLGLLHLNGRGGITAQAREAPEFVSSRCYPDGMDENAGTKKRWPWVELAVLLVILAIIAAWLLPAVNHAR